MLILGLLQVCTLMLRSYLSPTPNFYSDWLWPYCVRVEIFRSVFGSNENRTICFRNLLTFSIRSQQGIRNGNFQCCPNKKSEISSTGILSTSIDPALNFLYFETGRKGRKLEVFKRLFYLHISSVKVRRKIVQNKMDNG